MGKRLRCGCWLVLILGCESADISKEMTAAGHANTIGQTIGADHPSILYTGRVDFDKPLEPNFSHAGVSIKAWFQGTGVDVLLSDSTGSDYFNVLVDEKLVAVLNPHAGESVFQAARDLGDGLHSIEVFKRTESTCGKATFRGFVLQEQRDLVPPPSIERGIEFIGDSITCGYGNEKSILESENPNTGFHAGNENNYLAYGAVTGRALGARTMNVCVSGRGVLKNYDGETAETMPRSTIESIR
jgi:hypothetical protein